MNFAHPGTGMPVTPRWRFEVRLHCTGYGWRAYTPNVPDMWVECKGDDGQENARARIKHMIHEHVLRAKAAKREPQFVESDTTPNAGESVFFMHMV